MDACIRDATQAYLKAAELATDVVGMFNIASCYSDGEGVARDPVRAAQWYTKGAAAGYVSCQHNLAVRFEKGFGLERNQAASVFWFRLASEAGDPNSQNNLAICFNKGVGIGRSVLPVDYNAAMYWYSMAALQRDPSAYFNMGLCYKQGCGSAVPVSLGKAAFHLLKALELGHDKAKEALKEVKELMATKLSG